VIVGALAPITDNATLVNVHVNGIQIGEDVSGSVEELPLYGVSNISIYLSLAWAVAGVSAVWLVPLSW
jgi:hypothetical protein